MSSDYIDVVIIRSFKFSNHLLVLDMVGWFLLDHLSEPAAALSR